MTTISVVLATYNGARFVERQLESILAQTVAPTELLVADDGSVDDTVDLVRSVLTGSQVAYDVRVNDGRLGVTANFETLIARATGDLIVLCDQDDEWLPHRLEVLQDTFASRPNVVGIFSNADLIGPTSDLLNRSLWDAARFDVSRRKRWETEPFEVLMRGNVVTGATLAFRSEARAELLPIPSPGWHDSWIAMLLAAQGNLLALDQRLVRYRLHDANQAGMPLRGVARLGPSPVRREDARSEQVAQLVNVFERLSAFGRTVPPSLMGTIEHLKFRNALPSAGHRRALRLLRHTRLADYWRFSSGWLSLVYDFTRGGRDEG